MAGSTLASVTTSGAPPAAVYVSPGAEAWRRFRRHRLALAGALILALIMLAVALGPFLWAVPINDIDFAAKLQRSSWQHPFGTDDLGQDLLARMLYGGRISIGFDGYHKRPFHQSVTRLEHLTHFKHVLKTGSVKIVRSFRELFEHLDRYLKFPEQDREKRRDLIEKMCHSLDGRATERIADFVLKQAVNL